LSNDYWLSQLVDDMGIRSLEDARRALADSSALGRTIASYLETVDPFAPLPPSNSETIVAGVSLDLSGDLDCAHPDCIMDRVDDLFGKVWHYFDRVVVTGAPIEHLATYAERGIDEARAFLLTHIETLLYLRNIGGEDMLVFRGKEHWCTEHLPEAADKLNLSVMNRKRQGIVDAIVSADLGLEDLFYDGEAWRGWLRLPDGGVPFRLDLPGDASPHQVLREAATLEYHRMADQLAGDVLRADSYKAPLAVMNEEHRKWLMAASGGVPTEVDVALSLRLPVMENASPREILDLRRDEGDSFIAFQRALRSAIRERVDLAKAGDTGPGIAREVVNDIITPALAEIDRGLKTAARSMRRKSATRIVFTTTAVTAGLLTGLPGAVAAGVGALFGATALQPVEKFYDAREKLEMKDMYFLWHAGKRTPSV